MIANITHTSQCKPLIQYNEKKVEKGEAERIYFNGNDSEAPKDNVISEFSFATKTSKRIDNYVHISLNFTNEDLTKLDDKSLIEIGNTYLKEMGFPDDQIKIIYRHFDTNHPHIHIVIPKIVNGKALTNTTNFKKSMMITRDLEKKFNLSEVSNKREKQDYSITKIQSFINNDNSSSLEKVKAFNSFFKVFNQQHKPVNFEEYEKQLLNFGIEVIKKYRNNIPVGLVYKRSDVDEVPIKASLIYNSVPLKKIEKSFNNNLKHRENRYKKIVDHFGRINTKYDKISYDDLKLEFAKINIEVEFVSKGDIINAYRFYDKEQNLYYKPSAIDRKIAFSSFKNKIADVSVKNKNQLNNSILFYLEKQYKSEHGDQTDPMTYTMFMLKHGMVPVVRNNNIYFSHISVKSPEDKDYSRPVQINLSKIDFKKVSSIVNHKDYKKYVYDLLTPNNVQKNPRRRGRTKNGPILQIIDLLFNISTAAFRGRSPKLKIK